MSDHPYQVEKELSTSKGKLKYYSLSALQEQGHNISKLPFSIRILLENVLRNYDDFSVTKENIDTLLGWKPEASDKDIPY
jgi:aconitate hydratase